MLDEYKEDFGSGIDDLRFDTPEESYGYHPGAPEPSSPPQAPSLQPPEFVMKRGQPTAPQSTIPQEKYIPQHPFQDPQRTAPLSRQFAQPACRPPVDPVLYDQPAPAPDVPGIGDILKNREPKLGCLRVLVLSLISLIVIAVTFWGSFLLGQKIFTPPVKENFLKKTSAQMPDFLNPATRKQVPLPIPESTATSQAPEKIFVRSTGLKPHRTVAAPAASAQTTKIVRQERTVYRVIAGSFSSKQNAQLALQQLKEDGFDAFIASKGSAYQVQIGAFASKLTAQRLLERALSFGYEAFLAN